MSSDASDGRHAAHEWARLEKALARLIEQNDRWREQAAAAQRRIHELERALADVSGGKLDPVELAARAKAMEHENRQLTSRLTQAHEAVQRILGRLQFLEEDR